MAMNARRHFMILTAALCGGICGCVSAARGAETSSATATFEIRPRATANLSAVRACLPKGDVSVTIKEVRDTSLFDLAVTSETPQQAADRANEIAGKIQAALKQSGLDVIIWERAVSPKAATPSK